MTIKHDFHIHTKLSVCANETATVENYLKIAEELNLEKIGFANHFWDREIDGAPEFYDIQDFEHILKLKPELEKLAKSKIKTYFGCEAEYDYSHRDIAVTEAVAEQLDFILVPNSHTHLTMPRNFYKPYQKHVDYMVQAYEDIINSKVSKHITAIAHPFSAVCCPYGKEVLLKMISDDTFKILFDKTAKKGIAVEINCSSFGDFQIENDGLLISDQIRMLKIAKESGCKFVFGSDAHSSGEHTRYNDFTDAMIKILGLTESDIAKFAV